MNLAELRKLLTDAIARRSAIYQEMKAITARAHSEKRGLNQEEKPKWEEAETRFNAVDEEIVQLEKDILFEERMSSSQRPVEDGDREERGSQQTVGGIIVPTLGEVLQAMALIERDRRGTDRRRPQFEDVLKRNAQVVAARQVGMGNPYREQRTLGSNNPQEGGMLVGKDTIMDLVQKAYAYSTYAQDADRLRVGAGANGIVIVKLAGNSRATGSRYGGIRVYWVGETEAPTESSPKFETLEKKLDKMAALIYVPEELLEDAVGLESWIRQEYPKEMSFQLDLAVFEGNGSGKPLGFMSSPVIKTASKTSGQTARTFTYVNFCEMEDQFISLNGGVPRIYINRSVRKQLRLMDRIVGSDGQPVFEANAGIPASLGGYSIRETEVNFALGELGDVVLADMSQYQILEKTDVTFSESSHVRFEESEMAFKFTQRISGYPKDKEPHTPFRGPANTTYSGFVRLEARTS